MSAVRNQLPYTELKPIPIPREIFFTLNKVISKVALSILIIGFSSSLGIVWGLSGYAITVEGGAAFCGLIGVIVSIGCTILIPSPSKMSRYRLDTLKQVEGVSANPRILSALQNLTYFFHAPLKQFTQNYQRHLLHGEIASVTKRLDPQRDDVKKVWEAFLKHLDKMNVKNSDGEFVELDFTPQLKLLQGQQQETTKIEFLSSWSWSYNKDLEQIAEIEKSSFGSVDRFTKEKMKQILAKDRNNRCVVARRRGTNEILGFGWYRQLDDKIEIVQLARKPEAANLGIGDQLMRSMIHAQSKGKTIQIKMRKSNPAFYLFQKWGFIKKTELPKRYKDGPAEDGILLELVLCIKSSS